LHSRGVRVIVRGIVKVCHWAARGDCTTLKLPGDRGTGAFTIPQHPIRRRLHDIARFTITRSGEYCFLPGIGALRWLAQLEV
jgi:hypothetical protein